MLNIYLENLEEAIYYPPVYFDNRYEDEWIMNQKSREIIKDVDKSEMKSAHLIINLRRIMDFGPENFIIKIMNTGEYVHNMAEFVNIAGMYV